MVSPPPSALRVQSHLVLELGQLPRAGVYPADINIPKLQMGIQVGFDNALGNDFQLVHVGRRERHPSKWAHEFFRHHYLARGMKEDDTIEEWLLFFGECAALVLHSSVTMIAIELSHCVSHCNRAFVRIGDLNPCNCEHVLSSGHNEASSSPAG